METAQQPEPIHKCGRCNGQFPTEKAYLDHICESSGVKPTDARHVMKPEAPKAE